MRAYILLTAFAAMAFAAGCGDSADKAGTCGDGAVDAAEQCDDGSANGTPGDPCDATCKKVAASCGDGKKDVGEECDDGNAVNGDGCDSCKFTCMSTDKARDCAPADACAGPSSCNDTTHVCSARTKLPDKTPCTGTANGVCSNGACVKNGCGNGVRDAGEQCDDGNNLNLDGCDSDCKFEEAQRIISLQQQTGTDAQFCPQNALGGALTEAGAEVVQQTWDNPVKDGTLSLVFKFLGVQDLTGGDTPFTLGFIKAIAGGRTLSDSPTCGDGKCTYSTQTGLTEWAGPGDGECAQDCKYSGSSDLDWWYIRDRSTVDDTETPKEKLAGKILNKNLTAGPGTIALDILFGFRPTRVTLFDTTVQASVDGPVTKPAIAAPGAFSGHLPSENLDPALKVVSGSTVGAMCSKVSAKSLAETKIPQPLSICSLDSGTPAFTLSEADPDVSHSNTLLDGFVVGCTFNLGEGQLLKLINHTQPDGSRDGKVYVFTLGSKGGTNGAPAVDNTVVSCTADGLAADLETCLANATFSSYFKFATDRVIIRRE